jgi:hypothetical protein
VTHQPEETVGLDLFDETASAAGSFPHSMLGYERQAVDAYIRDIERQLSSAKRKIRSLHKQVGAKEAETDLSKVGVHARDVMRAAEAEAAEVRHLAQLDADRIIAHANEQASALTHDTHAQTATHRVSNLDDLNKLRDELAGQTSAELAAARQEAQLMREAAENHRLMVLADAERNATALRDQAALEAEQLRQAAQREAAEARAQVAQEHAEALDALHQHRVEVTALVAALADQARLQSEQFGANLEHETTLMNDRRTAATAEADQIVAAANETAAATIAEARAVAAKREREAGLAEHAKVSKLNEEIARLTIRVKQLRELLKSLSTFADFPDDEHEGRPAQSEADSDDEPTSSTQPDAHDEPKPTPAPTADDDATRVQPAASGGRNRR